MPNLLIAIGGTGQHIALAVSRLVFLGALPRMELAVIDADDRGELSNSLRTFGGTVEPNYTSHPLENGDQIYPPFDRVTREDPTVSDLLLDPRSTQWEKEVFELCFDEETAAFHVRDGMYGRPSVGATLFALNRETQLRPIFERAEQADAIYIAGSVVGGTGAGIIHQLVKAIKDQWPRKRIYGLIFLRWFSVPQQAGREQTISDATLERNQSYGLDYFFCDTRYHLSASLVIGLPNQPLEGVREVRLSAGRAGEQKHFLHLAAAYGIYKLPLIAVTEQADGSIFAIGVERREEMYDESWNENRALHWYVNRALFVKEILDCAGSQQFGNEILRAFRIFGNPEHIGRGLFNAISQYNRFERQTVVDEMRRTWALLSRQWSFSVEWVTGEEVLGPLPERLWHNQYREVRQNRENQVRTIQEVWGREIPINRPLPSPPELAREFAKRLVQAFE
ncbi:MAG: hypothetical protein QXZ28_00880 [Candidatus Methanomethylicaceae archaeon]